MSNIILEESKLTMLIPEKLAQKYNVFPIEIRDNNLIVEIEKENIHAKQDLKLATGMNIIFKKEDKGSIKDKINRYYSESIKLDENYARKLINNILKKAVEERASDIHIEPFKDNLVIRIRVDGQLKEIARYSMDLYPCISSVIKLDSSIDITEKRLPQDGRVDIVVNNSIIDLRISSIPTVYGEKIVIRILNRDSFLKSKDELGFSEQAIIDIKKIINKKSGILLITGPTGSGKTTTVYSILNDLRDSSKNIMSIEDPVEYKMEGVNQIQVNNKVGLTFEEGLRSILRQDPDIIMVGEIRDVETAQIAIRAAITGHLVISTMHTNDAVSSIARLMDMQIPTYLINSSLIGVIAQRLVRKVCKYCSHEIIIKDSSQEEVSTKVSKGCSKCNRGYYGRTAIYEILDIDDDIKSCIKSMKDSKEIKEVGMRNGMITFENSCKELIKKHITTLEECMAVNEYL